MGPSAIWIVSLLDEGNLDTDTQKRTPCEDIGRDWNGGVVS